MRVLLLLLMLFSCSAPKDKKRCKVGLCIVATGKYDAFARDLIESARPFFLKGHDVTYFVFTDGEIPPSDDVVCIDQLRIGWPYDTLKRFHIYSAHKKELSSMDYLFAIDADLEFVAPVGEEILGKTVACDRYVGKHVTYENNKKSTAYVSKKKGRRYFCGALYGGERQAFFKMVDQMKKQVDQDLKRNYIAKWHDESHLNRFFYDHPPEIILGPAYCNPEGSWMHKEFEKKIIARLKNHKEYQTAL